MSKRVTPQVFNKIKRQLRPWSRASRVAQRNNLHVSTVLNIKGCRNFKEYHALVVAEHQPTQYSIREEVMALHRKIYEQPNKAYIYPKNCKQALKEINDTI